MPKGELSMLIISSADPMSGPGGIALDYVNAFREAGYTVDFLTKFEVPGHPDFMFVEKHGSNTFDNFRFKLWIKFVKPDTANHALFYRKESEPPVGISKVLKKIKKDYDIILIYFWQGLLSYRTVEAIYDKMQKKPLVLFLCPDYSVMTGGCHFVGDCKNYQSGCGNCPMLGKYASAEDFTAWNVKDRIRINAKLRPIVFANTYMQTFMSRSPVMGSGASLEFASMILDMNRIKQCDRKDVRSRLGIANSQFVILFGSQNMSDERKGMRYLFESLNHFFNRLTDDERDKVIVLSVGKTTPEIESEIPFKQLNMGYIEIDRLVELYSAADVFISPSIDDAGPSMVNQSIACGTPVIAFEIGTAIDVIKNMGSGICVPLYDTYKMADAIKAIYHQTTEEKLMMRKTSRLVAYKFHSYSAVVERIEKSLKKANRN